MRYAYYPGCTLHGTAREYDESTRLLFDLLGLELEEIPDWNCCGATALASTHRLASLAVPLRNLALAEQMGLDVAVACSACFMVLARSRSAFLEDPVVAGQLTETLAEIGLEYEGTSRVRHTLDIVATDIGSDDIARRVTNSLSGLTAVAYYGCQIARPRNDVFDPEYPMQMDELLTATGLEVPGFDRKTRCCGAALMTTKPDAALSLNEEILREAASLNADMIVTTCPMCQMNVEAYQDKINRRYAARYQMPVLYFTQVIALALGLEPRRIGLHRHMVSTRHLAAVAERGVVS